MNANTKNIIATPVNTDLVYDRLKELRLEHGQHFTKMHDIYGLGLLLADYEIRIGKDHELGLKDLPTLLEEVVNSRFVNLSGEALRADTVIGIHHQLLEKHCFAKICADGKVMMLYHTNDRDSTPEEFNLAMVINESGPSGEVKVLYELKTGVEDDLGAMIDFMQLNDYESDDYVIEIPLDHPRAAFSLR